MDGAQDEAKVPPVVGLEAWRKVQKNLSSVLYEACSEACGFQDHNAVTECLRVVFVRDYCEPKFAEEPRDILRELLI